jgi:hypothetical protein
MGSKVYDRSTKAILPPEMRRLQRELRMRDIVSSLTQGAKPFDDEASLFTFKKDSHIRDAHWLRIDPCSDIPEKLCDNLAILVLRSNVAASVVRHDTLGKHALIRNPTRIVAYQSTSFL